MLTYLIIILAVVSRLVPHLPNLGAITALAIFSAAYLPTRQAIIITLVTRLISDLIIGFFSWPLMLAVYLAHLSGILLGLWIKRGQENKRWFKIAGAGFISAAIFFIITNFAWLYPEYPHNLTGIMQSYLNALPFLRGTMIGDVSYVIGLFGAYQLAQYFTAKKTKKLLANAKI